MVDGALGRWARWKCVGEDILEVVEDAFCAVGVLVARNGARAGGGLGVGGLDGYEVELGAMAGGATNLSGGEEGGSPIGLGLVVAECDVAAMVGCGNGQDVGAPADLWIVLAEPRLTQDKVIPRQIQGVEVRGEFVLVLVGAKSDGNAFVEGQREWRVPSARMTVALVVAGGGRFGICAANCWLRNMLSAPLSTTKDAGVAPHWPRRLMA